MRADNSCLYAIWLACGNFSGEKSKSTTRTWSCWKPAFSVSRLRKVRTNRNAPVNSTSESATCDTTSRPAQQKAIPACSHPAAARLHRNSRVGARGLHCRSQPEEHASENREAAAKPSTRQSGVSSHKNVVVLRAEKRHQHPAHNLRQHRARDRSQARQQQTLCQQLAHQPGSRRSQRQPQRHFPLAHARPRQHQIGQVRAGDQQHQPRQCQQQPQRVFIIMPQTETPVAAGQRSQTERQIVLFGMPSKSPRHGGCEISPARWQPVAPKRARLSSPVSDVRWWRSTRSGAVHQRCLW